MSVFFRINLIISLNLLCIGSAFTNNVTVSNVTLTGQNTTSKTTMVQIDISWDNSWRVSTGPKNFDGVWLFVKYSASYGPWKHATLSTTSTDHIIPSSAQLQSRGTGVFIYRAPIQDGTGTNNWNVSLKWQYGNDGVPDDIEVRVKVFSIEMVNVIYGEFAAGSGGTGENEFTLTTIYTDDASQAPSGSGSLGGTAGGYPMGQSAPNPNWPNGMRGFWCMKYEITQEQYADFLNTLTSTQAAARYSAASAYRYGITGNWPNFSSTNPYVACNFLNWMDGCAYADWAGLRPMTELEYEKACRGTQYPIPDEYAWHTTILNAAGGILNAGGAAEVPSNTGANCVVGNTTGVQGPMRAGCLATSTSNREQAGASFWGIMELSGNLLESCVMISGSNFTGSLGDGILSTGGGATNSDWPGFDLSTGMVSGADGSGIRGGAWSKTVDKARVSDRSSSGETLIKRYPHVGFRCVL